VLPGDVIDHLSLRLPPGVPLDERGRWERRAAAALDNADLSPASLPPQAILVVRRLADPRPGGLLGRPIGRGVTSSHWGEAPWQSGAAWGREARSALEAL
jgi:hypothetical protein